MKISSMTVRKLKQSMRNSRQGEFPSPPSFYWTPINIQRSILNLILP